MKTVLISAGLVLVLSAPGFAGSVRTIESGFEARGVQKAGDECALSYHDFCSGNVSAWTGYNGTEWIDLEGQGLAPARIGVCYDLNDCDLPCGECQNLTGVWFAFSRLSEFGVVDLEIYCANENCCPVGAPLGGFYDYHVAKDQAWKYFPFDGLRLDCVDCKFIVMVTVKTPEHCVPLSDANDLNRLDGCEIEWRCAGHSYCYRSLVDYCDVYGYPGRMLVGYSGACPPDDGFHVEWLSHAYISCGGTTATEKTSWSEIKALYK